MFTTEFDDYACIGDSITCEVDQFTITATLHGDLDSSPHDYDAPGCCFDTSDPEYGEVNSQIIKAWEQDEWFYVGVSLSVSCNGVVLDEYAASLWGVECNFPNGTNEYLLMVSNELLPEALDRGRDILDSLCREAAL